MNDDVAVIIRSVGERTEELCCKLVCQQVNLSNITVVHEYPFRKALQRSLEIGLSMQKKWMICIDADILIYPNFIEQVLVDLPSDKNVFGITGHVTDKFYDGSRLGGPHLYQTALLEDALAVFEQVPEDAIRPETELKRVMEANGKPWAISNSIYGVHDYEQYYRDIFRKMAVRANKLKSHSDIFLGRAILASQKDLDFLVAAWGIRFGLKEPDLSNNLDARYWNGISKKYFDVYGLNEKHELTPDGIQDVKRLVNSRSEKLSKSSGLMSLFLWKLGRYIRSTGTKIEKMGISRTNKLS